ncbi:hypothetical protein SUDANB171_01598 [Streptomyces sp. enrichment culture]|uniref:hypothetical protein n=1 Tax=Streptomyces sp. enrichment culture TaxID=1795815 RepID=UPI003F54765C
MSTACDLVVRPEQEAVCAQARRRGERRVNVLWVPHPHGPEDFSLRLGFRPTGEKIHGQVLGALMLE